MKKLLFLIIVSLIVLAGCNSEETTSYRSDLQSVADKMLENGTTVETLLDQYSKVWSYSIESKGAIPVQDMMALTGFSEDKVRDHFEINGAGNITDDFSTNIHSLNLYYDSIGSLEEIEEASKDIKSKITELNESPEGYEKVYDEILDMYTYSEEYIEMALNPNGSLQSFNQNKNQLSSDILSKHKRIEATMPSDEN